MNLALGLKAHSGWAALIVVGRDTSGIRLVERTRMELATAENAGWAKQPFHAAENLPAPEAKSLVDRAVDSARKLSVREIADAIDRAYVSNHRIVACGVIVPAPMPDWSVEEILAVHFRMHKAEGVLFPQALSLAAQANNLALTEIYEKEIEQCAERTLGDSARKLKADVDAMGRIAGAPWGKDQKCATLVALIALANARS